MGNSSPIGLIDSGIGGFTVLRELQRQLPRENIVYLGDAKRMPYGERENEEIIAFGNSDIRFLENMGVKAILLACNTISSLIESLNANVPLFSIVEAGCLATIERQKEGAVGLIATTATVKNGTYEHILSSHTQALRYITQGTRTLANVINNHPGELALLRRISKRPSIPFLKGSASAPCFWAAPISPLSAKPLRKCTPASASLIRPTSRSPC